MKSFRGSTATKYKTLVSRNYHEGSECDKDYLNLSGLRNNFTNSLCLSFVDNLPNCIYPRHLQEFYGSYEFDPISPSILLTSYVGVKKNGRLLPYARLLTTIFEYAKNELPNQDRCPQFKAIEPIFIDFNFNHLHRTDIEYTKPEHGASSSKGPQLDPRERMEAQVESWFDEDVWINVEDHM
ncbi:hypothetical protein Tco_1147031 [Tanacetum coccineum]